MKAISYKRALPFEDPESLLDVTLPEPEPEPHDLLVEIKAVLLGDFKWQRRLARRRSRISMRRA